MAVLFTTDRAVDRDMDKNFVVLVCGGRDYKDRDNVVRWMDKLFAPSYPSDIDGSGGTWLPRPDLFLIEGGAKGADTFACEWAVVNWVRGKTYEANWEKHGKAAGFIRNQQMIDEGKPNMAIAFPGGSGTADMIQRALLANIPVLRIP